MDRKEVYDFIEKNSLCVLSTANKSGKPQSAVMAYCLKDDSLFIFTETSTRKYKNILENKQVSVVVGGLKEDPTVQIDGTIAELSQEQGSKIKTYILSLHPEWKGYFDSPNGRWFEIKTSWMRYSNFSVNPPEIKEY